MKQSKIKRMIIVKNKSLRFFCLLLGLCLCVTGCNFGGGGQTDLSEQEEKNGHTMEIIVPGGKTDESDKDKDKDEEKDKDKKDKKDKKDEKEDSKKSHGKPFWQ